MPCMAASSGLLTGNAGERRQASADGAEQGPSQAPRRIEVAAAAAPRRARFHAGKAGERAVFAVQADCWAFPLVKFRREAAWEPRGQAFRQKTVPFRPVAEEPRWEVFRSGGFSKYPDG